MTFGSPVEWSSGAKAVAIVIVAVLLLAVGAVSHARAVVEASYECPVVGGEPGALEYSLFDPSTCAYDDSASVAPIRTARNWLDPLGSALVFGIGGLVVVTGAALALRTVVHHRPRPDASLS